jgi:multidrug efflux pump subunit AcrA (membrane-fusion protein)
VLFRSDRDPRILPEMGAKVEFVRPAAESGPIATAPLRVMVPSAAVVTSGSGSKVWVVEGGRAGARTVEVGPPRGDQLEIRKGLNGGESVILSAPAGLKDGDRVRIKGA